MISIQDKLRQGDMDFSTLPDEATLADILQHTHAAVQHDKATDIALQIVRSFTVSEVDLMISERNKHGDVKRSQYTTPTAILVEMIRDDILANASDDNADIMDKYGIKKEIERNDCSIKCKYMIFYRYNSESSVLAICWCWFFGDGVIFVSKFV